MRNRRNCCNNSTNKILQKAPLTCKDKVLKTRNKMSILKIILEVAREASFRLKRFRKELSSK